MRYLRREDVVRFRWAFDVVTICIDMIQVRQQSRWGLMLDRDPCTVISRLILFLGNAHAAMTPHESFRSGLPRG